MELDKRIIDGKKPLDCFDTEIAKQFIGKKGYFGAHESQFMNLDTCPKCVVDELKEFDNCGDCPFITSSNHSYRLFLPAEWVKEPKKKYRPFTKDEFLRMFNSGIGCQWITMKSIATENEYYMQVTGCFTSDLDITYVCLGSLGFTLETLFTDFQWKDNDGNWRVFGIEVEE